MDQKLNELSQEEIAQVFEMVGLGEKQEEVSQLLPPPQEESTEFPYTIQLSNVTSRFSK